MWMSKQLQMAVVLVAVLAIISFSTPSPAAAHPVAKQDDEKKACIQNKDGTKDCTPIFLEVGEPLVSTQATCSGYGCDGQDPYGAGCAVSYGVIDMRYIYNSSNQQVGYVQLWWSNTCQTNWARTVRTASYTTYVDATVVRDDNPNRVWDSGDRWFYSYTYSGTAVYSPMVYAPSRLAMADGTVDVYWSQTGWN